MEQQVTTKTIELLKTVYEDKMNCHVLSIKPIQDGDFYRFEYSRRSGVPSIHTVRKSQAMNMISNYLLVNGIDLLKLSVEESA